MKTGTQEDTKTEKVYPYIEISKVCLKMELETRRIKGASRKIRKLKKEGKFLILSLLFVAKNKQLPCVARFEIFHAATRAATSAVDTLHC